MENIIVTLAGTAVGLDEEKAKALLLRGFKACHDKPFPECGADNPLILDGGMLFHRTPMNVGLSEWYCRIRYDGELLAGAFMDSRDL